MILTVVAFLGISREGDTARMHAAFTLPLHNTRLGMTSCYTPLCSHSHSFGPRSRAVRLDPRDRAAQPQSIKMEVTVKEISSSTAKREIPIFPGDSHEVRVAVQEGTGIYMQSTSNAEVDNLS